MLIFLGISYLIALFTSVLASNYVKKNSNNDVKNGDSHLNWIDYISMILLSPIYLCTECAKWTYRNYPLLKNMVIQFLNKLVIQLQIIWINVVSTVVSAIIRIKHKIFIVWMNVMFIMTILSLITQQICTVIYSYVIELVYEVIVPVIDLFIQIVDGICTMGVNVLNFFTTKMVEMFKMLYRNVISPFIDFCTLTIRKFIKNVLEALVQIFRTHVWPTIAKIVDELLKVTVMLLDLLNEIYILFQNNFPLFLDFVYSNILHPFYYYCLYIPVKGVYDLLHFTYYYLVLVPIRETLIFLNNYVYSPIIRLLKDLSVVIDKCFQMLRNFLGKWIPIVLEKIEHFAKELYLLCYNFVSKWGVIVIQKLEEICVSLYQFCSIFLIKWIPIVLEKTIYLINQATEYLLSLIDTVTLLWNNIYNYILYPAYYYFIYYPFYVILYQKILWYIYANILLVVHEQLSSLTSFVYNKLTIVFSSFYDKSALALSSMWIELSNMSYNLYCQICIFLNQTFNSGRLTRLYIKLSETVFDQYNILYGKMCFLMESVNSLYIEMWNRMQIIYSSLSNKIYDMFVKQKIN